MRRKQLALAVNRLTRPRQAITVVKPPIPSSFDQPCPQGHLMLPCQSRQPLSAWAIRNWLRDSRQLLHGKIANEPITRNATPWKNNQTHSFSSRLFHKALNLAEIRILIPRRTLELHRGNA